MVSKSSRARPYHYHNLHSYDKEDWYNEIYSYLISRYSAITNRLVNCLRYVDLNPLNKDTFSFEFASLLRDICGTLSSVLDSFVKNLGRSPRYGKNYNIRDYRDFLLDEISDLNEIYVSLNVHSKKGCYVCPFEKVKKGDSNSNLFWWKAYNEIKHTEIYSVKQGCLSNVIYAFCALTMILKQVTFPAGKLLTKEFFNETGNLIRHVGALSPHLLVDTFPEPTNLRARNDI